MYTMMKFIDVYAIGKWSALLIGFQRQFHCQ